ncbi:uncharacterized protein LOC141660353 [Apium graveolens]|uniref:uncharacterized protein LOC141660353 n=1 Tax=Apium graveolens TaxID=4045 RepID=UPI003D7C0084
MSAHASDHVRWYKNRDVKDGEISHPADGEEWKNFDRRYPSFAQEIRNIRLGLATDGFNLFGPTGKKTYSVWPVVIVFYNLPPSMCMKKPYMFMTDIVPGPNSIGKDINVCLRPLIDKLKILWNTGVKTYNQSLKQNFTMRAAIMWTISDYPAMKRRLFRGRLSGEGVKELLDGLVFPHPERLIRRQGVSDMGKSIIGLMSHSFTNSLIGHHIVYDIQLTSCIRKQMFLKTFFTIVNTAKSKYHKKARANCKHFGVLPHLWIDKKGKSPKAPYSLIRKQRKLLCEWISSLKLPDGYSSNISRCCNVEECIFYGFKLHDCHIFLQKLLPLAIRELLMAPIADAITAISNFFQDLCSSVVTKTDLEIMEKTVIKALCLLEMIFLQSWFDSMEHLVVHLAEEIRLAGSAYWHWMYPIERLLGKLKQKVDNKARVEGSIAERYMEEEIFNICSFILPLTRSIIRKYQDRVMRQRPETTPQDLDRIVKSRFKTWFKQKIDKDEVEGPHFKDLLEGPVLKVMTFDTYQVNGYKFSTKSASGSGIVVKGNLHGNNLDYVGNGVRIDKNRVITIDMTSRLKSNEIFILASQASQVYYAPSVLDPKAKIYTVVKSKSRPIDESIVAQNDIENAFQEDRSNASTSFSLFVDFAQYGQIPFIWHEEEDKDE